jgi:hypothetical protein
MFDGMSPAEADDPPRGIAHIAQEVVEEFLNCS